MPHFLLSPVYYRMAILMERDGDEEGTLRLLDKELDITKLRKGNGDPARIMIKKASILSCRSLEERVVAASLQRQARDLVMELEFIQETPYAFDSNNEES